MAEEPEIALPRHTQRRVARFVLAEMGQSIVTSHSPYIIEQFEPEQIVILNRNAAGVLTGQPIDLDAIKPKTFRTERRQYRNSRRPRAIDRYVGALQDCRNRQNCPLLPHTFTDLRWSVITKARSHKDTALHHGGHGGHRGPGNGSVNSLCSVVNVFVPS